MMRMVLTDTKPLDLSAYCSEEGITLVKTPRYQELSEEKDLQVSIVRNDFVNNVKQLYRVAVEADLGNEYAMARAYAASLRLSKEDKQIGKPQKIEEEVTLKGEDEVKVEKSLQKTD